MLFQKTVAVDRHIGESGQILRFGVEMTETNEGFDGKEREGKRGIKK